MKPKKEEKEEKEHTGFDSAQPKSSVVFPGNVPGVLHLNLGAQCFLALADHILELFVEGGHAHLSGTVGAVSLGGEPSCLVAQARTVTAARPRVFCRDAAAAAARGGRGTTVLLVAVPKRVVEGALYGMPSLLVLTRRRRTQRVGHRC